MSAPPPKKTKLICAKKIRYADEFAARVAAMESISVHGGVEALSVYHCPHCKGWHLTKKLKRSVVTKDDPFATRKSFTLNSGCHGGK